MRLQLNEHELRKIPGRANMSSEKADLLLGGVGRMEFLVRSGVQEEVNGPFVFGPFHVIDVEDDGLVLEPGERLLDQAPRDPDRVSLIAVKASVQAAMADPRMGEVFTDAEGATALRILRIWKLEMWSNASAGRPPRDVDGNVLTPEITFNFDPRDGVEGFDWAIFNVVLATLRRADEERTLAERALVAAVRDGWEKHNVPVAQFARRIGWSPEYTRLVAKGERLPGPTAPVTTRAAHTLYAPDADGAARLLAADEPGEDPEALIAAAMTLLGRAQAMLQAGR
jgi:hypothetical protein